MNPFLVIAIAAVFVTLALSLVGCVGFVCWGAVRIFRESVARSRSADETVAKNLPVFMQTAAAISERIDARAAARVKIINAGLSTAQAADDPPTAPIAGEMPPMYMSSVDAEAREADREAHRLIREGADPVRDQGIGNDMGVPPMPSVRTEAL